MNARIFGGSNSFDLFCETQRFRQLWLWALLLSVAGLVWYIAINQLVFGIKVGDKPAPNVVAAGLCVGFGIILPGLFAVVRMQTTIDSTGIRVAWLPYRFTAVRCYWAQIESWKIRRFRPITEFGGWGVRNGTGGCRAVTMSGNVGLELILRDGTRYLIGTQRTREIEQAMLACSKIGQAI